VAGGCQILFEFIRDYPVDKQMRQSWQGGQSPARRKRGLPGGGAHGVTRPTQIVCHLDNPKFILLSTFTRELRAEH
jgi:hypothetical protein